MSYEETTARTAFLVFTKSKYIHIEGQEQQKCQTGRELGFVRKCQH